MHGRKRRARRLLVVAVYADEDGKQAMRLTPESERVAWQLPMLGEEGQDELMEALLEAPDDEA
jgi:hypothetical protein